MKLILAKNFSWSFGTTTRWIPFPLLQSISLRHLLTFRSNYVIPTCLCISYNKHFSNRFGEHLHIHVIWTTSNIPSFQVGRAEIAWCWTTRPFDDILQSWFFTRCKFLSTMHLFLVYIILRYVMQLLSRLWHPWMTFYIMLIFILYYSRTKTVSTTTKRPFQQLRCHRFFKSERLNTLSTSHRKLKTSTKTPFLNGVKRSVTSI